VAHAYPLTTDIEVSLMRVRRRVNECPACMSVTEAVDLTALGGKVRPYFRDRDGKASPGVQIVRVLCCFCREYHHPDEVAKCMAIERPKPTSNGSSSSSSPVRMPMFLKEFPELWEFLEKPSYKDGTPRQPGRISFGLSYGGIQVTLTDPSSSTYCSRNYPSVEDALLALEVALAEGSLTWRASGPLKGRKRP